MGNKKSSMPPVTKENFIVSPHAMKCKDLTVVPGIGTEDANTLRREGIKKPGDLLKALEKQCDRNRDRFREWLMEKLGKTSTDGEQENTVYYALVEWRS